MQEFINRYRDEINGTLSGFDRLVFRGTLRRLHYGHWNRDLQCFVAGSVATFKNRQEIGFSAASISGS
jgi:hypothetical protein